MDILKFRSLKSFSGNTYSSTDDEVREALITMFSDHGFDIGENGLILLYEMLTHLYTKESNAARSVAERFAQQVGISVFRVGDPNDGDGKSAMFTYERNEETWLIQMNLGNGVLWTEPKKKEVA